MAVAVLIPAYNPERNLVPLVEQLCGSGRFCNIIIVNDGSRDDCQPLFARLATIPAVTVLHHAVNLGKGAALKTGLNYACWALPHCQGVVTADADGQHRPGDVVRVARRLQDTPDSLILGTRRLIGRVPLRSRLGNVVTKYAFWALVGKKLDDTQCGLRGIPRQVARELLPLKDSGYEFELDMLIHCKHARVPIRECPVATVYLEGNRSSHFHPLLDSLRIYCVLLRFVAASLVTAAVDYLIFLLVYAAAANIVLAQALARLVAGGINFSLTRNVVFHSRTRPAQALAKYVLLVLVMGATSYSLIQTAIHAFGFSVIVAKISSELLVYLANFAIQRDFVFREPAGERAEGGGMKAEDDGRNIKPRPSVAPQKAEGGRMRMAG